MYQNEELRPNWNHHVITYRDCDSLGSAEILKQKNQK
jgi:hypothetical protein